jgi:hypothetical protein
MILFNDIKCVGSQDGLGDIIVIVYCILVVCMTVVGCSIQARDAPINHVIHFRFHVIIRVMEGPPTTPARRWRRRPKLPTKRTHHPAIPSSLPPSSPLPSSSSSPLGPTNDEVDGDKENDDPFGLLAAEVRIKAKREVMLKNKAPVEEEGNDVADGKAAEGNPSLVTPSEERHHDQDASSLTPQCSHSQPSPPSPLKPSSDGNDDDVPEPEHLPESPKQAAVDDTAELQVLNTRGRKKNSNAPKSKSKSTKKMASKEAKPKSRAKSEKPKSEAAPLKGRAKKREPDESGDSKEDVDDDDEVMSLVSRACSPSYPVLRQQLAKQREARIEYFRKLDNYVLEKENVWVV